jgi:hypothetical protein
MMEWEDEEGKRGRHTTTAFSSLYIYNEWREKSIEEIEQIEQIEEKKQVKSYHSHERKTTAP